MSVAWFGAPPDDATHRNSHCGALAVDLLIVFLLLTITALAATSVIAAIRRSGVDVDEQFETLVALAI